MGPAPLVQVRDLSPLRPAGIKIAFMAGVFFHPAVVDQEIYDRVEEQTSGITTGFLAPIFFASHPSIFWSH